MGEWARAYCMRVARHLVARATRPCRRTPRGRDARATGRPLWFCSIRPSGSWMVVAFCLGLMLHGGGCVAVGVLGHVVSGPPTVPARYVPEREAMLVLVEAEGDWLSGDMDAEHLTRHLTRELAKRRVAPTVDAGAVHRLREDDPAGYREMSIPEIAQAAEARQVLYVELLHSGVEVLPQGDLLRGSVSARVRVVDTATGRTRWPEGTDRGEPVGHETPWVRKANGTSASTVRSAMHQEMAEKIVRLFYTHKVE